MWFVGCMCFFAGAWLGFAVCALLTWDRGDNDG